MSVRKEFNQLVFDLIDWWEAEQKRLTEYLKEGDLYILQVTDAEFKEWLAKRPK